jgi:hypothetical protein
MTAEGLAMRSYQAILQGAVVQLRLWSQARPPVVVQARVVHAMRINDPQEGPCYLAGVEFLKEGLPAHAIEDLLDSVVSTTSPIAAKV